MTAWFRPLGACLAPWSLRWTWYHGIVANDNADSCGSLLEWQDGRFVRL